MNPHIILIVVAIFCELVAAGIGLFRPGDTNFNLMALGLFFYFMSSLVTV